MSEYGHPSNCADSCSDDYIHKCLVLPIPYLTSPLICNTVGIVITDDSSLSQSCIQMHRKMTRHSSDVTSSSYTLPQRYLEGTDDLDPYLLYYTQRASFEDMYKLGLPFRSPWHRLDKCCASIYILMYVSPSSH